MDSSNQDLKKEYRVSCHCGKVGASITAPAHIVAWDCNCSVCQMKKNTHFVVPEANFTLDEASKEFITTYTFNTHVAKHTFCSVCGVQAFYRPRSNPDGYGITLWCVTPQPDSFEIKRFDGSNWEDYYASPEGAAIKAFSKQQDK